MTRPQSFTMSNNPSHSDETIETSSRGAGAARSVLLAFGAEGSWTHVIGGDGPLTMGRGPGVDIILPDPSVSRVHARLTVSDHVTIEDLGSKNGVSVGGAKLPPNKPAVLASGQFFEVGSVTAIVQTVADATSLVPDQPAASMPTHLQAGDHHVLVSQTVQSILRVLDRVARSDISLLLLGETGVGKDIFAELLHGRSDRAGKPFMRVHCAAITESLFESELFGHDRGAFTGANRDRKGLLESAEGGTVFLDEIGELPLPMQVKLLRALEERRIVRVGSTQSRRINVRFVAATNRDLRRCVDQGTFRRDLYYRLAGIVLTIPPLRERREEVLPLAESFVADAAPGGVKPAFSPDALALLRTHDFPGNVRELRGMVERGVLLASDGMIRAEHLQGDDTPVGATSPEPHLAAGSSLAATPEAAAILEALQRCAGNQTLAARELGVSRRTLINRIIAYGIARPRKSGG